MATLSIDDVAAELGRSRDWLYGNWRSLVAGKKMPKPVCEGGHLTWSAAQFYAWLDRELPSDLKAAAAAFRAAERAYAGARQTNTSASDEDRWRQHLNRRFVKDATQ